MSKQDRNIILFVLLATLLIALGFRLFPSEEDNLQAQITLQGNLFTTIPLDHQEFFTIDGVYGPVEIEIEPGKIRVAHVTCPDQICRKTGWISRSGQVIVCIPNQLVIQLIGPKENLDAIVY